MTRRPAFCRVLLERLSAYLDGDLPAGQCRSLEAHARTCPRCAGVLAELRQTIDLCRSAAGKPLPPAVRKAAKDRIRRLIG
ncbi:MAG TPA: zf-HC2 domain-containing protein [Vicinamibacterales bacterium]|nr:zf-HC2 domain-containing protein [Vicinamibacterales bacterium]